MIAIDMAANTWHGGVPGSVGESPLLGWVWWPPFPAGTVSAPTPSVSSPVLGGGGGGGVGCCCPGVAVGVVVVVGVGTSGLAGCSSAPGTAVPSW